MLVCYYNHEPGSSVLLVIKQAEMMCEQLP